MYNKDVKKIALSSNDDKRLQAYSYNISSWIQALGKHAKQRC